MSRNFELLEQIERELADDRGNGGARTTTSNPEKPKRRSPQPGAHVVDCDLVNLVQSVFAPMSAKACRQVVFCGIGDVNSSSSVCSRVAKALAVTTSEKVCVVEANTSSTGLADLPLSSPTHDCRGAEDTPFQCAPVADHLWLATPPSAGPAQLLPIDEWRARFESLRDEFTYVLIDASRSNAGLFGQISDGAILVIEADSTRRDQAAKAKASLEAGGVRLLGTVLHNRSFPVPKALYDRL